MKSLILILLLVSSQAFAGTAFFTGRQEMVQTVTYQTAWRCEYNYNGQYFYQLHQGFCPSSVQVY
jgi:hypothetical protein